MSSTAQTCGREEPQEEQEAAERGRVTQTATLEGMPQAECKAQTSQKPRSLETGAEGTACTVQHTLLPASPGCTHTSQRLLVVKKRGKRARVSRGYTNGGVWNGEVGVGVGVGERTEVYAEGVVVRGDGRERRDDLEVGRLAFLLALVSHHGPKNKRPTKRAR